MTREQQLVELARRADEQAVLVVTFKLMTIPYSDIVDIEVASVFLLRFAEINLSNGIGKMCRIKGSRAGLGTS